MEQHGRLWTIRKTVFDMLIARGYIVAQQDLDMTLETFKETFPAGTQRESMTVLASKKDTPTDQIFVFFSDEQRIGVKPIRSYMEKMEKQKIGRAILVCGGGITPFAKSILQHMQQSKNLNIEQFQESELMVNITEHVLVPKHTVMTDAEKKNLLSRYHLKDSQLPRIQKDDPIARFYGLAKGQVVKIIRPSETAGRYVTYRLVM
jgi:DNA-directed RNA polymerase I, II, and III subunit RPABC1